MRQYEHEQAAKAVEYDDSKPALLFASSRRRLGRAERPLAASGVRLAASLSLEEAPARLDEQASIGLVWLELGEEDATTPETERLLRRLNDLTLSRDLIVIASVPIQLVDLAAGSLTAERTEILVDPDDGQRAAALALALSGAGGDGGVTDVGKDNAARLRQLSDEMGRIASTLARLSTGPASPPVKPVEDRKSVPGVDAETVRAVIRARRLRSRFFSEELFADPAWDMLLDLLQAEIAQLRVPVSSLCIAAAVPATTALRWIKTMTEQGLFLRRADPHDGRRIFVELAPAASEAMRRYFAEVSKPTVV